jgi:hypothetical protein
MAKPSNLSRREVYACVRTEAYTAVENAMAFSGLDEISSFQNIGLDKNKRK